MSAEQRRRRRGPPSGAAGPRAPAGREPGRRSRRRRHQAFFTAAAALVVAGAVVGVALALTGGSRDTASVAGVPATRPPGNAALSPAVPGSAATTTLVPRADDPAVAFAQQYEGTYAGMFRNRRSGTTGDVTLLVHVDAGAKTLRLGLDFDGDLFGTGVTKPRRMHSTIDLGRPEEAVTTETAAFGPVTATLGADASITASAPSVPGRRVERFDLTGRLAGRGFEATFRITYEDGSAADGTVSLTCVPGGERPSEVTTLCSLPG